MIKILYKSLSIEFYTNKALKIIMKISEILTKRVKVIITITMIIGILIWIYTIYSITDWRCYVILSVLTLFYIQSIIYILFIKETRSLIKTETQVLEKSISQMEQLISLNTFLKPVLPLPILRASAISPDMANILINIINEHKPDTILECGSGSSTLIMAYALEKIGKGKIISLDHIEKYADKTKNNLRLHNKENFTDIIFAPLMKYEINNKKYDWYDTSQIDDLSGIDLLFIDGPPRNHTADSRYPALPLLIDKLNKDCYIILDDSDRKGEQAIIKDWMKFYPGLKVEFLDTEKGTAILKFNE